MHTCLCLLGLPGASPDTFLKHMFWCLVQAVGQLFHRLWLPYTLYPWKLAGLLDSERSLHEKTLLATEFLELDVCCLNSWWGKPLRDRATTVADLVNGSCTIVEGIIQWQDLQYRGRDELCKDAIDETCWEGKRRFSV